MKIYILTLFSIFIISSCSSDESESTSTVQESNQEGTTATVNLTVLDINNVPQEGYIIMMFNEPVSNDSNLPEILMQKVSNSEGKVKFDLEEYIQENGEGVYYFEAFIQVNNGYTWKSLTHPSFNIESGGIHTSSIFVN